MTTVLVTGGTGHLGSELVPRLRDAGHDVVVLSRQQSPALATGVRTVRGNLETGEGIEAALAGVDVIAHLASATDPRSTFSSRRGKRTEVEPTRRWLGIAKRIGSPHIVYTSIVGIDRVPYPYYKTKLAVETAIRTSGLPHTIFRSTQWHTLAWDFVEQASSLPVIPAPKGMRMQLLDPREVADRLVTLVAERPAGFAPEMGGPEILPFDEIARTWLEATGKRKRIVRIGLPGKAARAFSEGGNLTPDHADGTITWRQWLAAKVNGIT